MQGNCTSCGHRIVIDDAKVPERAFQVKCPKCQNLVRFPGKGAAAPAPAASEPVASAPAAPSPGLAEEEIRAQVMAQVRREIAAGSSATNDGRALVALADKGQAGSATLMLTRLGFEVDTLDDAAEGGRLLEQGLYDVVVTTRAPGAGGRESLYQRMSRLAPEARRHLMLVLVGDEFKTGDGTQAWACLADLVVHSKDIGTADAYFRNTSAERARLYLAFNEARKRWEAAAD